jgi:hypothetical protein
MSVKSQPRLGTWNCCRNDGEPGETKGLRFQLQAFSYVREGGTRAALATLGKSVMADQGLVSLLGTLEGNVARSHLLDRRSGRVLDVGLGRQKGQGEGRFGAVKQGLSRSANKARQHDNPPRGGPAF